VARRPASDRGRVGAGGARRHARRRVAWGELEQPKDFNHGQPRAVAMRELERQASIVPLRFFGILTRWTGTRCSRPRARIPGGASPFGTRDQAGNVAEWTADAYFHDDLHRGYDDLPAVNPFRDGSATQMRVVRGGSWRQPSFVAKFEPARPVQSVLRRDPAVLPRGLPLRSHGALVL